MVIHEVVYNCIVTLRTDFLLDIYLSLKRFLGISSDLVQKHKV